MAPGDIKYHQKMNICLRGDTDRLQWLYVVSGGTDRMFMDRPGGFGGLIRYSMSVMQGVSGSDEIHCRNGQVDTGLGGR